MTCRPGSASSSACRGRAGDRPDQRRARHLSARAGLHRHAHHAVHRPRPRARPDRRPEHRLCRQAATIRSSRWACTNGSRLQQSDHRLRHRRASSAASCWRARAGATRPMRSAATCWRPAMPASTRRACASAPSSSPRCARPSPASCTWRRTRASHSQYGQGDELIVIAAVIIGGASILGGRGRIVGACLGAILIVLIDKVLREGVPITRIVDVGGTKMEVQRDGAAAAGRRAGLPRADPDGGGADRALDHPAAAVRPRRSRDCAACRRRPPLVDTGRHRVRAHDRHACRRRARSSGSLLSRLIARREAAAMIFVGRALAHRLLAAAGFLGQPRQHLQSAAGLQRDRADDRRHGLCDAQRRYRSLRRRRCWRWRERRRRS